ncbi:Cyclopentanol dehydrogenase [compost metagenome]
MSKVASIDFADDNIRVNSVHPGPIATDMTPNPPKLQAIKRLGRPEEVSALVLFLASDDSSYCTGSEFVVDGGYTNVVGELLI